MKKGKDYIGVGAGAVGEHVFEMIGNPSELGGAIQHSFAHVVIPSLC